MFKALMGGGRPSSDLRSNASSSSKSSRRKADSKSTSSRKSSRGDDRDRGLGDLSAYPPSASGSRRGPPSAAGDSVASFMTAEPEAIDSPDRILERAPKRRDSDRDSKSSRRRDRDRSESRDRDRRRSRRSTTDGVNDDLDRERNGRERRRTQSGDVPPVSTSMPSNTPGAQFAADIAAPGFSQFPMQYDNPMPPASFSPGHDSPHGNESSPSPYDPHVQQQFPGQFPAETAEPYFPPNPAGAAADYYGDQGQSVQHQPGVRPSQPLVIPNTQTHLMSASPSANPPPEPSSLGQVGAAASYFDDVGEPVESPSVPPAGSSSRPPKPSKPSKPSNPSSSSAIPAGAAAATYGIGSLISSNESEEYGATTTQHYSSHQQSPATSTSKPPHSHGIGAGVGAGAAAAAAGYMIGHQHHSSSPTNSHYTYQNYEPFSQAGTPQYGYGPNDAVLAGGAGGYAAHAAYAAHVPNPGFYPHGTGSLAVRHRPRGPLSKFADFWRDPEGVGRFEDYTETIGVCKYCFQPGTSSLDAPRKHHYHRRRHSADRYSSSGSSRISKLNRYQSSEDEGRQRNRSKKSSSWLPGMLAGSLFAGKEFNDSYSVRSGRVAGDRASSYDGDSVSHSDRRSYTSRGVVRRSGRSSPREYHSDTKHRGTRSRSRSSSRSRHSFVKEAALGAAVGGAALAASKSHQRTRSRSPSRTQRRKDSSSSSSFVDVSRPASKSFGGLASFFTASSENRKKKRSKKSSSKRRGLFSFNSSSSSSLDADLAFGTGFTKKPKPKQKKGKKGEDVDAALLGLGATATALAASSHGRSRSTGQIITAKDSRSRHSNYASSANEDDEWVDAESDGQSSSVSSALAFGGSSTESGSDSSGGRWAWGWGTKKNKKNKTKRSKAALAAGAGAIGGATLASMARSRDSRVPSSDGSLKQVHPVPTSDPSRFDVATMSPSVYSGGQPPLVRPGPIPLQQPQPVTPVSQSVYTTQGGLPGSIPAYSAPAVPPIFANEYNQYGSQVQGPRDAAWVQDDAGLERRVPRRSDSSPVFPTQDSHVSSLKRRSTTKDQASVSFDLTEEQAERERRLDRRNKKSREDFRDEPLQLIDREEESARRDSERRDRDRRRADREDEKRRDVEKDRESSSSWAEAAAVGAIGAAAASSLVSSRKSDERTSEVSSRRGSERRRAERRRDVPEPSAVSQTDIPEHIEDVVATEEVRDYRSKRSPRRSPRPAPVYDDYAEFYAPKELRHSPDEHARSGGSQEEPTIVEVVPASEREPKKEPESYDDLPQFAQEPYEDRDHLPWPVPRLHFIQPTPPQSVNGSTRGTSSPVVPPEPVAEEPAEEAEHEIKERERPSTGSRVSWGEHSTHEYEVPSSSEQEDISPLEDSSKELSMGPSEGVKSKEISSKPDFGTDVEFAATIAAGAAAAGFDPSFITDDPKYHTRTSPPGSEDEGVFSPHSKWDYREGPHGFVEGEIDSYEPGKPRDPESSAEHVIDEKAFVAEPESFTQEREVSLFDRRERSSIAQEVIEQLNGKHSQPDSPDNDVFSMPGGFDTAGNSREFSETRDDARSVFSAPVGRECDSASKSRKSRRSGDDFELPHDIESPARGDFDDDKKKHRKRRSKRGDDTFSVDDDARSAVTEVEGREDAEKSERRKRRSKRDSDTFSVDDDAQSAITDAGDRDRSERRKHRHRSSRDKDFDDTASITSSPARLDETREKRRSKDDKEKDKGSGSFLRNIFGSRVSAPESHSRSSSLDKRSSREAISEAGIDDERRRKKRSSRHRSSSGGDKLDDSDSGKNAVARDDMDLEEYRSSRQRKEERRRQKYEDIVESGRRREFEKDGKPSDYNDDSNKHSFLEERPEMPAAAERNEQGDSGLDSAKGAAIAAAGLALGEELIHQRPRSRSTSPPAVEKALDLAPKSQSRPSSPETARENQSPQSRRMSSARSTTESPTAVPLHFRRPPLSPGLQRSTPADPPTADSPGSPTQTRHRRLNSVEFRHSREIRPLWLVERHGSAKVEPEVDEQLPSLPSSKTSSRAPSVEDLRALNDEDAVKSWEPIDFNSPSLMERRKAADLSISTSRANESERDADLLGSQQATPTAENFDAPEGSAKKEKPKYEFHSPSELLQDPAAYPELPSSPTMEALPSVEGSMVGVKESGDGDASHEQDRGLDVQESTPHPEADTPTQEKSSFFDAAKGAGFAGIVDAAVAAAVKGNEEPASTGDMELSEPTRSEDSAAFVDAPETAEEPSPAADDKPSGFGDVVDAAVAAEVARYKAPVSEQPEEPVTAIEEQAPQLPEPAQPAEEPTKALPLESTELPKEPVQPQSTEEPTVEEPTITQSSKKKKKKKGKKGQVSQSVDSTAEENAPTGEEPARAEESTAPEQQTADAEVAGDGSRSIELEAPPAAVEQDPPVQPEPAAEPVEAPKELEHETLPAPTSESISAPAQPKVEKASNAPESQPESATPADAPVEPEPAEDTAGLSKKAKRDKKKQKKNAKKSSISEQAEDSPQPSEAAPPTEEAQPEQKEVAPDAPQQAADVSENAAVLDTSAPADQEPPETTRDITETTEPSPEKSTDNEAARSSTQETPDPAEDSSKPIEDTPSLEPPISEAHELDLAQPAPNALEATKESPASVAAPDEATPAEITAEPEFDAFHEAVEEQPVTAKETKEIETAPSVDVPAETAEPIEAQDRKPEEVTAEQPKKKNKKGKKNRKSVAVEETETPSEPKPASEPEVEQVPEEIKPEQSTPAEPTNTQAPLTGGETQPSEPEQPAQDTSEPPVPEEPVASQGSGPVSGDGEPTPSTEPVEPGEESRELPVAEEAAVDPETEAQMTPAQKKKAKKDKKKRAKQQNVSSVPEDEKPAESEAVETGSAQPVSAEPQLTEPSVLTEPSHTEAAPDDETKDTSWVPEAPTEPENKDATEPEQSQEEPPKPATVEDAPIEAGAEGVSDALKDTPAAERAVGDPEAPQEKPELQEVPAEPEVPMTAAQRKKAKKAKKKQQEQQQQEQQQQALSSAPDDTQATETKPAPQPEAVESSKDATFAAEAETPTEQDAPVTADVEAVDSSKDIEVAPDTEAPATEAEPASEPISEAIGSSKDTSVAPEQDTSLVADTASPGLSKDIQSNSETETPAVENVPDSTADDTAIEPSSEAAPSVEDPSAPADAPQDDEKKTESLETEQPKEVSAPAPPTETLPSPGDAEAPLESEANMTAAQRIKAKREKKQQQKRQSEQLEAPPATETEPPSIKDKDAEKPAEENLEPTPTPPVEALSDSAEVKSGDEVATVEASSEPKLEADEGQGSAPVEDAPIDSSTEVVTTTSDSLPDPTGDAQPVSEESVPETPKIDASSDQQDPKEPVSTDGAASDDKTVSDQPLEEPSTPAKATAEATAADEPAAPMSKKEKKKKKKRQSLAVEEEAQPEPAKGAEPSEPTPSESVEESPAVEPTDGSASTEEPQNVDEPVPEESSKEIPASEEPSAEAEQPSAETEVPMTAAQKKKAKKDKKKRKSVAWEDEPPTPAAEEAKPETESAAPAENVESQDMPAAEAAPSLEQGEPQADTAEAYETPIDQDITEYKLPAEDIDATAQDAPVPAQDEPESPPTGDESHTGEAQVEEEATNAETKTSASAIPDEQAEPSADAAAPSEDKAPVLAEAPSPAPDTEEQAAEAGLSAKERRKLKKKEKKKGKSVDMTQEEFPAVPEVSQEPETVAETQVDPPKVDEHESSQVQDAVTSQPENSEAPNAEFDSSKTNEPALVEEQNLDTKDSPESTTEAEKNDDPAAAEPDTASKEPEQVINQEPSQTQDLDDKPSATETAVEPESTPKDEKESPQTAEPEAEASMSAKERRKAKKKEKKRQSKNIDADDNATTTDSPVPEAAPAETESAAVDTIAQDNEKAVPAETETPDPLGPVTAPSPAEDDGKEHQSHDMPSPDTPAKDLTSTDEFVSSQVEQPQLESRFSDYPPQSVLEHDLDFGEKASDGMQKEDDVVDAAPEPELSTEPKETGNDQVAKENEAQPEEGVPEAAVVQEEPKIEAVGDDEKVGETVPSPEEEAIENPEVEETPVDMSTEEAPDATVPVAEEQAVEEDPAQTALSKKQKKKEKKKKNQKQEESKPEEVAAIEPTTESQDEATEVPASTEETESKEIAESAQATEPDIAPVIEESPADPTRDADVAVPQHLPTEQAEPSNETKPAEDETPATDTQQLEEPLLSRKLSKKEKKKQRQALLAQEAEAEANVEEKTSPETVNTSDLVQQSQEVPPLDNTEEQTVGDVSESHVPDSGDVQETPQEIDQLVSEEQDVPVQEGEQLDSSIEPQAQPQKPTAETDHATAPGPETVENPPTGSLPEKTPGDTPVEPQEEQTAASKKKSKKEKKKAAAAAAAAAAMEKTLAESQPAVEGQAAIEGNEEVKTDETRAIGSEQDVELDSAGVSHKQPPPESSVPQEEVISAPVDAPEQSREALEEEPKEAALDEPISRKLSKKEKKKAKKQGKQEPVASTAIAIDGSLNETANTPEENQPEDASSTQSSSVEESKDIATEAEPTIQEVAADVSHGPDLSEDTPVAEPDLPPVEEQPSGKPQQEQSEEVVPQTSFNDPTPTNFEDQDVSAKSIHQEPTGTLDEEPATEKEEQTKAEEVPLEGEKIDPAANAEVAGDVAQDVFLEPEVAAPLSKKLSKKEKRKAKKKGLVDEPLAGEQEEEVIPEPSPEESKAEDTAGPAPADSDAPAPIESESTRELDLEAQAEPIAESQPPAEPLDEPEQTAAVAESTPDEAEPTLSRKASKKKAKKAKKANQALDLEPTADRSEEKEEATLAPEKEASFETKNIDLSGSPTREAKPDDEEWPSIEWEHGKHGKTDRAEPLQDLGPDPEPEQSLPVPETIEEFDEAAVPAALQEAKKEPEAAVEEESWSAPLSKKDKKKAKKNKRKSEQASTADVEVAEEPFQKKLELAPEVEPKPEAPKEIETEPPERTVTPGGSKIANIFPGLERGGFRRAALNTESGSGKDSAEDETAADLEANRDIAIPVSEAPQATTETEEPVDVGAYLTTGSTRELLPASADQDAPTEDIIATNDESTREPELPVQSEPSVHESTPSSLPTVTKEQSSMLPGSPASDHIQKTPVSRPLLPSQMETADGSSCELQRTPTVIHGRHEQTPRTWNLEEPTIQAVRAPSPPRSLFGGPFESDALSRPRTPLDTIAEQEPTDGEKGTTGRHGTPRLEIKPEHVLPRPTTPVRKFTDNALARESWPTPENEKGHPSLDDLPSTRGSPVLKTPEQGMPVLKPSSSKGKLRRTNRSASGDLRAVSRALDSQPPGNLDLDQLPSSSSSYNPVTDKGKAPARNMPDVFEGWGETPSSPRSPSRPPSVRRRRSMQHLQDIETRLDQLISENRLLIAARDEAEDRLRNASVARRKSDQALNTRGADLRDKEAEVEQLKNSVEWLQKETSRLTQENEGLTASNAALAAAHAAEVHKVRESSTRALNDLRSQHTELSTQVDDRVRQEIESALAQKDTELRRLRQELEDARDKVKELQQQISASVHDNALVFRDEDYFDAACQKLCGHVQQWVLRFSKHSDHRRCRALSELHDDKIADRFDNALLDGSDADAYLGDRVRRRDVFMSVVMTMVWEYIFTRYLFGMDREQRQKLKSLEKQLGEVGPGRAVHRWRATTLTLLSRRPAFASQRQSDTEAVALEIFGTLSRVLPPPSHVEGQLLESLRKVLRVAVNLSLEMRTQLAEFIMLPPLQPEYDTNGDLARQVFFNAALMNERSGETSSNDDLEAQQAVVRIVLFPLVVKKGNDVGEGDDEVVVCPAQVLVARPGKDKKVSRMMSGDRMSVDASRSVYSVAPSVAPSSMMDTSNVI